MTKEEHIENLETIGCDGWTVSTEAYKSLQWAIKALEQEPILDKIRAEIETEADSIPYRYDYELDGKILGLEYALQIIDKYRDRK